MAVCHLAEGIRSPPPRPVQANAGMAGPNPELLMQQQSAKPQPPCRRYAVPATLMECSGYHTGPEGPANAQAGFSAQVLGCSVLIVWWGCLRGAGPTQNDLSNRVMHKSTQHARLASWPRDPALFSYLLHAAGATPLAGCTTRPV